MNQSGSYATEDTLGMRLLRDVLRQYGSHKCLDIGCGILKRPAYMVNEIEFTGIDPQKGGKRDFDFIQCEAEDLPFDCESFDSVLFGTSIDHLKDPSEAISEAQRVLKPGGHVIIWLTLRPQEKYDKWIKEGGRFNELHTFAFTEKSLIELMSEFTLVEKINIKWGVNIFVFGCTE